MDLVLKTLGIEVGWDDQIVLPDLSLEIARGEALAIVGPGRSGKSTLLHLVEVMINGPRASEPEPWWVGTHRVTVPRCARLRQHGQFEPDLVGELLARAGLLERRERWLPAIESVRETVDAVLQLPLNETPDPVRRFLSFVVVAYSDAPLLLFDEPSFALTGPWADAVRARLAELTKEDRTMIIVTHHLPLARAVADRVMLVIDGVEIESAPTEDFFCRARQPRTRQYIEWGA